MRLNGLRYSTFQNSSGLPKIGPVVLNVIAILHDLNGYSTDGENLWTVWESWLISVEILGGHPL